VHSATRYMTIKRGDYVTVGTAAYKVCKPYSSMPIEALKWCIRKFPSSGAVSCHSSALPCPTSLIIYLKASRTTCKGWKEQGQFSLTPCSRKKKEKEIRSCTVLVIGAVACCTSLNQHSFWWPSGRGCLQQWEHSGCDAWIFVAVQYFAFRPTKFYLSSGKQNKI